MCRRLSLLDPVTTPAGSVYERTFGATLSGVRSIECAEVLALDVYRRANGRPLTVRMVRDRLEQTVQMILRCPHETVRVMRNTGRAGH